MTQRHPGQYWIVWTDLADIELRTSRPGPLIGEWDGRFWWFARMQAYKFDCEVDVIGSRLSPPEMLVHLADRLARMPQPVEGLVGPAPCP